LSKRLDVACPNDIHRYRGRQLTPDAPAAGAYDYQVQVYYFY
jgi:hypothetical protein